MFKFGKKKNAAEAPAEAEAPETLSGAGESDALSIESEPKKKAPLKLVLVCAAAGVLVLGGGGGAAWFLMAPKGDHKAEGHKPAKKKKSGGDHGKSDKPADKNAAVITDGPDGVVFYTLPDIVVNMQTADGRPTFLKLKLTLELEDGSVVDALEPARPRMKDMFQTFLRELRPEDLAGSQGSYQLRMEILRRVNLIVAPAQVKTVLIEEMLIN